MSREGPDGWRELTLAQHVDLLPGLAFRSESFSDDPNGRLPLIRIRDLVEQQPELYVPTGFDPRFLIRDGDFLVGMDGEFMSVRWQGGEAALNQRVMRFQSASTDLDSEFLFYRLQPELRRLEQTISATTVKHLAAKHIRELQIDVPPVAEQRRIAEILSSVDEAIQTTQVVIEQTRRVKQGVMERALLSGLEDAPTTETEIGLIPRHWTVATVEALLADVEPSMRSGPFGSALLKNELVPSGIPFLGIDNVHVERFEKQFRRFVTPTKFQELRRYAVRPKDIMITIMGTVGRCCVVPDDIGPALSSKHVWTLTFDQNCYLPELICWQLNFAPWVLGEIQNSAQGGIMAAISSPVLRKLKLPVPPMDEQRRIADIWLSFYSMTAAEEARLQSLHVAKRALLEELLSGRRRVIANLPLAAE